MKIFNKLLLILSTLTIGVTSFGISAWYFNEQKEISNEIESNFKIDDIKENYRFGKDEEEKTYTIYFFPSTAYMFLYGRYLVDETNTYGTHHLPEEEFGYKEVLTNENGNVLLNDEGKALYKLSENNGKYDNNASYDGAYKSFINKYFLYNDKFEIGGTASGNSNDIYYYSYNKYNRDYGLPNDPLTFNSSTSGSISETTNERYNGHDLFSNDRFGAWEESYYYGETYINNNTTSLISYDEANNSNTGRYIPIKLVVTNTMSIDLLSKAIQSVFTSMGDHKLWFNFTFTNWTYVSKNNDGSYSFPYSYLPNDWDTYSSKQPIAEAYSAKEISHYFDVFEDLEKYADENGVIRLFPLFSNGKTYNASSYESGGGDCFKLVQSFNDSNKRNVYKYFMPSSERINGGSGNFNNTSSPNKYVRYYNYNYLKLNKDNLYKSLSVELAYGEGISSWTGNWYQIYQLDTEYINNSLIAEFGDGLYNLYLFEANFTRENASIIYDDFYELIIDEAIGENGYPSLKGKKIKLIDSRDLISNFPQINNSPVVFGFEKIGDPKIINNIDLKENNGELTYDSIDKMNEFIKDNSDTSHGFYRFEKPIYGRNLVNNNYAYSNYDLNEKNPYIYLAKNVNFMNSKTNYFMILFSDVFNSNFTLSIDNQEYSSVIINPTISGTVYSYDVDDLFVSAKDYISLVNFKTDNGDIHSLFKLNSDDAKGLYDILLIYNENDSFSIYFYRHANLFCKLFDSNLNTYQDNFVNHDENIINNTLIFKKKYFLGLNMERNDLNNIEGKENETLEEAIINYAKDNYKYNGEYNENEVLKRIKMIDRVTKTVVAKFEFDLNLNKYKLVCYQKIYKNYIFYLTYNI